MALGFLEGAGAGDGRAPSRSHKSNEDKKLARVVTTGNATAFLPQPSLRVIRTDRAEKEGER